jgi:Tfp pilus assembly protein PilF/predicted Ser/Thr protein kinase
LGEGGMGVVYEAEQEHPRRTVALKVTKSAVASPELRRRFELESLALGRLQHPGIAQIYEAGTAETSVGPQQYFAMEFVHGSSLLDYAEAQRLSTPQRLEVVVKICEAVHHAHQRGLIHRDLKPSNILVDEMAQPKILDFGVVRATDSDAQVTRQTDLGQLVGTLAYMSPEQVLGDPLELDSRSDVYALGVILYELIAGRKPYHISPKLHEAVQTIREEEPTPLSSISPSYRGDVETIVAKALEKDKTRRYSSAAELAADIRRYLHDEPIVARPASAGYQFRKFARRHKAVVAGTTAVFVVLVCGIVASSWQAARATRAQQAAVLERNRALHAQKAATVAESQALDQRNQAVAEKQRADTESATAKAIIDFLQSDLLSQASAYAQSQPDSKPDPDIKVRTALDRAAARISSKFDKQPLVEASIRHTIGNTYWDLGLFPQAQRQVERAANLRRRVLGDEHPDTLQSMGLLADLQREQGRLPQAEALFTRILEIRRRKLGPEHRDTLASMSSVAAVWISLDKYAQAAALLTKALEIRRRVLPAADSDIRDNMYSLAVVYSDQGKYPQAERLHKEVLELDRKALGANHPYTLNTMAALGQEYTQDGKYAEAQALLNEVLDRRQHVFGQEHPDTLESMADLALLYIRQGKYPEAEPLYSKVLQVQIRVLGENHPDTLTSMNNLGVLYRSMGKYAEAEPLCARVVEIRQRLLGPEHPDTLLSMYNLGVVFLREGKNTQAEALFSRALEVWRRVPPPGTFDLSNAVVSLGRARLELNKYAEAELLLREAVNRQEKKNPDAWERYSSQSLLGASLAGQGKYGEAEPLLLSGFQGLLQRKAAIPSASRYALDQAGERIIQLYRAWGKPEKAAEWRQKLQ